MSAHPVCFGVRARALGLVVLESQRSGPATIGDRLSTRAETAAHSRVDLRTHKGSQGALDARVVSAELGVLTRVYSIIIRSPIVIHWIHPLNARAVAKSDSKVVWGVEAVCPLLEFHHRSAAKRQSSQSTMNA